MDKSVTIFCIIVIVAVLPILSHNASADLATSGNIEQNVGNGEIQMYVSSIQSFSSQTTKLVHVNVIFKNLSYKPQSFNLLFMSLTDNNGNSYNPELESKFTSVEIASMDTVDGEIIFSLPATAIPTNFVYQTFGANPFSINLTQTQSPPDLSPQSGWILEPNVGFDANDGFTELKINNENLIGNEYVVNVSIKNVGQDTIPYNPLYAYVKDTNGKVYSWSPFANVANQLSSGNLSPSQSVSGDIAFDVGPTSGTNLMFIWDSSLGSGSYFNTGKLENNVASVNTQNNPNQIQNTTQYSSPQSTLSIPETNQTSTSQIPMKTYQNNEYNFTIQYPSDWIVKENYASANGNIGVVQFESDETEAAALSVWGKLENTQQLGGNQYLNKMVQDAQNLCSKNNCTFQLEKSEIIPTNGLTHYIITGNQYWVTTISNSTVATAQFYIEDDIFNGNDIWKLYGFSLVTDSSDIPKATVYYDEIAKSLASFTILGTSQPTSSISSSTTSPTNQSTTTIPSWIHNTAKWWSEGSVGDNDFVKGVQYLIQQKIIIIPNTTQSNAQSTNQIPPWVKGIAGWWADGKISDSEFIRGIQFLVQAGIIKV